jgi:hypothetical protein
VLINFKSGAGAGLFSELISYYLKRSNPYLGDFKTFLSQKFAQKGIAKFYNGLTISTFYQSFYRALNFGIYDSLRLYLMPQKSYKFHLCFPSGYVAALLSSTLAYPMHIIVLRMVGQRDKGLKALIYLFFEGRLSGLWKGWRVNFLGSVRGAFVLTFNDGISFYSRKKHILY